MNSLTILITGSNRGIGFEMARQLLKAKHKVILSARDEVKGIAAINRLQSEGIEPEFVQLDITSDESIQRAAAFIKSSYGKIDVLMNNAAILLREDQSLLQNSWDVIQQTINADAVAQLNVVRNFQSVIADGGKIIFTSSGGGSMTDPVGGWSPAYCISKSLMNATTRHLAYELNGRNISVNAFCPGWVRTDMGGKSAPRTVEHGADTGVWLATTAVGTGQFFRDRKVIPW